MRPINPRTALSRFLEKEKSLGRPKIPTVNVHVRTEIYQGRVFVHILFPDHELSTEEGYYSWSPQGRFRSLPVAHTKNYMQEATDGEVKAVLEKYNIRVKRTKFTVLKMKNTKSPAVADGKDDE